MSERVSDVRLQNGTVIRHRVTGYEGKIDGTTEIRDCFTSGGERLARLGSKHTFQYRIVIAGESARRIAPAEDLEILEGVESVFCPNCRGSFQSKPGTGGKPRGRCQCGGWICPSCWLCQGTASVSQTPQSSGCLYQRKRLTSRKKSAKSTAA